ncbi:MAG: NADP-dependent oxidoreductase [Xanthomonadales bacterium]|jgi:NADPH-dependent curcumin reductase CurA|nr:NADP-dependent oxidoreductase [Xanthomonadales bacterium]MDH3924269.1 NADP-dependent oxidoreductase [Xanthomonadales bacterium]MDH3939537.1 NADP-dependent oxidoreductase [Xanthomonadales bacterium]MDH4001006.1 NADP-dependent oxidoreductase [Xanthomonadales bacterium]
MTLENTRIVLASRPAGEPVADNYRIEKEPVPKLKNGQVLIKVIYLSLDPYMRGRMSKEKSYADPVPIGGVITGETAGVVIKSKSLRFTKGEYVCCPSGWQSYFIAEENDLMVYPVDPARVPLSTYLGVCGMPGRTAYFGLLREGKPSAGETIVVSAASGAVGSVVGQIARMERLRVVGVAGGPEKCDWVRNELGFDECIDYKAGHLDDALAKACPNGIDIYFESVGGALAEAVAKQLNPGARVPICGYISSYNARKVSETRTPFHIFGELENPPWHQFFLVFNYISEYAEANLKLTEWVAEGKIKYRETIVEGLENAPEYFNWLFRGKNFGKLIVQVAEDPA